MSNFFCSLDTHVRLFWDDYFNQICVVLVETSIIDKIIAFGNAEHVCEFEGAMGQSSKFISYGFCVELKIEFLHDRM